MALQSGTVWQPHHRGEVGCPCSLPLGKEAPEIYKVPLPHRKSPADRVDTIHIVGEVKDIPSFLERLLSEGVKRVGGHEGIYKREPGPRST